MANSGKTGERLPLWARLVISVVGALALVAVSGAIHEATMPDPDAAKDQEPSAPKPGDVLLFYRPRRGRDYFIRWFTRSLFYHAALYAGDDTVIEARPSGVRQNPLADRARDYLVVPAPNGRGDAALAWARTQIGDGYDGTVALVIGLEHIFTHWHINYTPPGKYSCAELVTKAFEETGFEPFEGRKPYESAPGDWARYLPAPLAAEYAP